MPEYNIRDSLITSMNAQEPWPENVKLFQPYEVEQILLPDNASCLAVQAFLKMCNLPFEVEMRWNAEFMSPSGRVPFIKCGAFVVSELEPIVQFACNKGVSLCNKMSTEEKAEMRAYMSLITNVLVNAELYVSWLDSDTYSHVTRVRNSSVYPWPLGWIQTRTKRNQVAKRLRALHWHDKTMEQVLADVEQCCNSLSQRLGDKEYFFGSTPSPLDASVYGHMRALLSAVGPRAALMIKPITSALLKHTVRMTALSQMILTPQEEYLLTQAFLVSTRQYLRTDRARTQKSKLIIMNPSYEQIPIENKEAFGKELCFKPFASKKLLVMASKEGIITCKCEKCPSVKDYEKYNYVMSLIEQVYDKAMDVVSCGSVNYERDFEVLVYPAQVDNTAPFEKYVNYDNYSNFDNCAPFGNCAPFDSKHLETITEKTDASTSVESTKVEKQVDGDDVEKRLSVVDDATETATNDSFNDEYEDVERKDSEPELRPTELDALVFGHVFTIITTRLPCRKLAETVKKFDGLVKLAKRIDENYFKRP